MVLRVTGFFAWLLLLAPFCSTQRPLKLLIKSAVFRRCPPRCHTRLVVNLCTRTAEAVPSSCDPHLLAETEMAEQPEKQFLNHYTATQYIHENYQQLYFKHLYVFGCKLLQFRRYLQTAGQSQQLLQQGQDKSFELECITVLSAIKYVTSQKTWNSSWLVLVPSRYFYSRIWASCLTSANTC